MSKNIAQKHEVCGTVAQRLCKNFGLVCNVFEQKNTELSEKINELKSQVEESSTVEEKEDGTIELCLNGKVYVGTLKEV